MTPSRALRVLVAVAMTAAPVALVAQFRVPNTISVPGDVATTLGPTVFINRGLVGVGRMSASATDSVGDSFGSMSGMQVTNWRSLGNGTFAGTLNILPDRGYNTTKTFVVNNQNVTANFFADYPARIQAVDFTLTPYTGAANLNNAGDTVAQKIANQHQMVFTLPATTTVFRYDNPSTGQPTQTTGLDPDTASSLFGQLVPFVHNYTGLPSPSSQLADVTTYTNIDKLPLDSEALIIKADGSGYVGDEYGGNVYYFDATKKITGVIVPPVAMQPHSAPGVLFFSSTAAPNPIDGRRPNQGLEGVALSPDGSRLFVLLQSATMQDSDSNANQSRRNTRLLVYDVSGTPTPLNPILEYPLTLPTYRSSGNGSAPNSTCQQSEVVALDNTRFLFLPRDGNGLGNSGNNPSVFKSVLLVDLGVDTPTDFHNDAAKNAQGGTIATVTNGTSNLLPGLTAVSSVEAVNILNTSQLTKFNVALDSGTGQVSKLTLGEKWEGLALVPALDPANPDDYFLFVGNDNDFLTSAGKMHGPGGLVDYNGFDGYPGVRTPAPVENANNENDSVVMVFRVTITQTPQVTRGGFVLDRRTGQVMQQVTITNTTGNVLNGPIYLALDSLSANATAVGAAGTTQNLAPVGSPYFVAVPGGGSLLPGTSTTLTLRFTTNPPMSAITYTPRVLVLTGSPITP